MKASAAEEKIGELQDEREETSRKQQMKKSLKSEQCMKALSNFKKL